MTKKKQPKYIAGKKAYKPGAFYRFPDGRLYRAMNKGGTLRRATSQEITDIIAQEANAAGITESKRFHAETGEWK